MLKTKLFTIALTILSINAFTQIVVTDVDILSIGDVVYLPETNNVSSLINPGSPGQNQTWDFSSLQVVNTATLQCISPNGTPHALSYPNANLCIEENGDYTYFNKSSTKVEFLGEEDSVFQQILVVLPLPLHYGLSYTDGPFVLLDSTISGSVVSLLLASQGITAQMISAGAAHIADTFNIHVEGFTDFNVDAWGSMTIPMGTFDCLRLKIERTSSSQFQVFCIDTLTGAGSGWYPLSLPDLDQETSYQWWSNNISTKFHLAEIQVDSAGNVGGNVSFLHNLPNSSNEAEFPLFKIYPIPSTYKLNIELNSSSLATYQINDLNGNLIIENTFNNTTKIDLSNFAKGSYLLNISTEKRKLTKKIVVQ